MKWKFAFGLASDDLFFVTTRACRPGTTGLPVRSKVTTFHDENEFLEHLIRAGLRDDQTSRLALAVLLSVAKPVSPPPWTEVDLTQKQMERLHVFSPTGEVDSSADLEGKDLYLQAARSGSLPRFYDMLMQVPTAIAMLVGPEHRFTFVNAKYTELIGAKAGLALLGRSVVEVFPELQGKRTVEILDRVYGTGQPNIGKESLRSFYREKSGRVEDGYFDTVCQPICNAYGEVCGIMVQSTDVTEMVLARDVREHRERLLYRQWAELEAIYRTAPVAMMLIDAKDFRILRLNEKQAELLGLGVAELLGKPLLKVAHEPAELRRVLTRVLNGEPVKDHVVEGALSLSPAVHRYWLKSYAPTLSAAGTVESIILVAMEISEETRAGIESVATTGLEVMV